MCSDQQGHAHATIIIIFRSSKTIIKTTQYSTSKFGFLGVLAINVIMRGPKLRYIYIHSGWADMH